MLKSFLKMFSGGSTVESSGGAALEGGIKDLENFVDYIVRSLVDDPDAVRVSCEVGDESSTIKIDCKKDDIGKIIGKRGKNHYGYPFAGKRCRWTFEKTCYSRSCRLSELI